MRATDLMIGDWVCNKEGKNERVTSLYGGYICTETHEDSHDYHFKPIPLTPEILEKNGFWFGYTTDEEDFCSSTGVGYPQKGWCWDEGAGIVKIIYPTNTDGGLVVLYDGNFDRDMNFGFITTLYVHELQHALKLCRIKKEITL